VVLAGLAAHALLLATDYVVWDGWWQFADIAWPEGPAITKEHLSEVGRPLDLVYYAPFRAVTSFSNRARISKLLGVVLWISSACCMVGVLWRATRVPHDIAVAIGATAAACPVFALLGEFSLWMYTAAVFLFWLSWLGLVHLPRVTGLAHMLARSALWVSFFLSFNLNSQLVAFYAICGCLFASRLASRRWQDAVSLGLAYACRFGDFLLLPIAFWIWKKTCTPSTGAYADYNTISASPSRLLAGFAALIQDLLVPWIAKTLASESWLVAAVLAAIAAHWTFRGSWAGRRHSRGWASKLVAAGLFLLAAHSFPYLVVGQTPSASGWLSRNAILTPLPLALMAVGTFYAVADRLPASLSHAWKLLTVAWVVLSCGACARNYLSLQAFGVKQDSISLRFHEIIDQQPTAVIQMRDYFPIPGTIAYYPPSIWTFLPTRGSLQPRTFVFETGAALPDQRQADAAGNATVVIPHLLLTRKMLDAMVDETTLEFAMQRIPRVGRHVLLCIRPSRYTGNVSTLGFEYLRRRWFDHGSLEEFVRDVTTSESVELPALVADP
jgi:hypothetical protein